MADDSLSLALQQPAPLTFDLILATVDRVDKPRRFLAALERQSYPHVRIILVDQNEDDRLLPVVAEQPGLTIMRVRAERGLSRARNAGLRYVNGDVVAFPDDDCAYPDDLLERVAGRLAERPELGGLTGKEIAAAGHSSQSWAVDPAVLTPYNFWNRAISFTIFLRRQVVEQVGSFDEALGLGAGTPWSSGEEIDYVLRAVRGGARIEYDPALTVTHELKSYSPEGLVALGYRDGASLGYLLRKHGYPLPTLARMAVRPVGGAALALGRGDVARARFHARTLRGRVAGYRGFGRLTSP